MTTRFLATIAVWGALVPIHALGDPSLLMVLPVEAPVIEKKTIKLNVDLVFDVCPQDYWVYYNKTAGRLVVEFFGVHVNAPAITIRGTKIVSELKVVNNESVFALNNKNSQISMVMKSGWHYDSWIIRGKVLRLQLWMPLNPYKTLNKKNRSVFLPVLISSIVAVGLAVGTIILLSK